MWSAAGRDGADVAGVEGVVERVTFHNPENGFSVLRVRIRGRREPSVVVGTLPAVQPGERLILVGRWQTDPRRGVQFRAAAAEVRPPATADETVRYLGSGLIPQLGPTLAARIVAHFGAETLAVLDATPARVREVPGIGPTRAAALAAAWEEHRALRAVSAFLSAHGLDARYAPRLIAAYGLDAPHVLGANPYRLVAEIPGLGFRAADRLGRDLGVRPAAPARLQAAVHAAALRAGEAGHTRTMRGPLLEAAAALATVDAALLAPTLAQLLADGTLAAGAGDGGLLPAVPPAPTPPAPLFAPVPTPVAAPTPVTAGGLLLYEPAPPPTATDAGDGPGIGLRGLVRGEAALATRLRALAARPSGLGPATVGRWLAADGDARALSDEQRAAVAAAATRGLFILTGGPGVGKTTTVRTLVRCLRALGRTVALAAPTGKAAQRLGDVVGLEATTLHRLLGAGPQGFRHGERDPLRADTVIVDEASMLDTRLARAVAGAIGPRGQLILVGDADQLPSVGPGQVLRDLLAGGDLPATTLTTVFRQAARSAIVRNAHAIRRGEAPALLPAARLGPDADCVFIEAAPARVAAVAAAWAAERLPRHLGVEPGAVQTLAPLVRVCQVLNGALQGRLNPACGQAERPHGALALRVGDRVIQTRNNYTLGVVNGDTGVLVAVAPGGATVDFGDGRVVAYAPADLLDVDHAYCLTVHRAQGSEWPGVVLLVSSDHGRMLTRNLLYTALTRARRAAVIVGDAAAVARAVAETRDHARRTGLAALLAGGAR